MCTARKYQTTQKGRIGITLSVGWAQPLTDSADDRQASDIALQFDFGAWADPIWFGDYPDVMKANAGSLLPRFTEAEKRLIKGSADFQGINYYTASWVQARKASTPGQGWYTDRNVTGLTVLPNGTAIGKQADSPWLYIVPWSIKPLIQWVAKRYDNPPMMITENGMDVVGESDKPLAEALHDTDRVDYFRGYISFVEQAIDEGANMVGYFLWSLEDNFEWADGYSKRFGIHYVDYAHERVRYPKDSAKWYTQLIKNTTGNPLRREREEREAREAALTRQEAEVEVEVEVEVAAQ